MTPKITHITALAGVVLALVAVPTALAKGQLSQGPVDASDRAITAYPDVIERAVLARERASRFDANPAVASYPDAVERAVPTPVQAGPLAGHVDRYEIDLPKGPVPAATTGSGSEIEWPQLGIGFGVGITVVLGLMLATRLTRRRPLAHG